MSTDAEVMRAILKRYDEYMADRTAQAFGTPFAAWAAAKYPDEYVKNKAHFMPPEPQGQATSDADKLRRLREGLDKWGWCAEFGALAAEVLREAPQGQAEPVAWCVAQQMGNVMYNMAQKAGHTLTSDDVALFDRLRKEWDAARRAAPAQPTPAPAQQVVDARDGVDAARYRWLTYAGWIDDEIMEAHGIKEGISETLDAAIDAAMKPKEA